MSALPLEPFDDSTDRQPWPLPPAREDDAVRNQLALAAAKQALRRFTGEPLTGFGVLA